MKPVETQLKHFLASVPTSGMERAWHSLLALYWPWIRGTRMTFVLRNASEQTVGQQAVEMQVGFWNELFL